MGPLHVSVGTLHVTWGSLNVSWRSWGPLHVAHPIVVWHVAMCPRRGPHHPALHWPLGAHHVPLGGHHAPLRRGPLSIPWTHSSWRGPHHSTGGPLHPSGSRAHVRSLGAHVSGRTRMSLHVRWSHHSLWGPLVGLGSRKRAHLSRGHEGGLQASGAHRGPHGVGYLLRGHVGGETLLSRGYGAPWTTRSPTAGEWGHGALRL